MKRFFLLSFLSFFKKEELMKRGREFSGEGEHYFSVIKSHGAGTPQDRDPCQ